ncbi:MAG: ral nucleoside transport system ATP-binding protein [Acidobacteriota bacterium]|jgi:simple sugar transport system ATP-binding protein|nr:ral nucleoside transport system ATP-binding protein [Acidobacteriota bacterium]
MTVALAHITKSFGANRAVDDVTLDVRGGEILALVGENGAGKTTLMRIAAGELARDSGDVKAEGRVELVHQHFMLVNEFTIAENLALTRRFRFATRRALEREAQATVAATGIDLADVSRRVGELSVGEKSKLELIKAISKQPATLILDEPTSVLTPHEAEELFAVMRRIAAAGTAVVFISHKLPEVLAVADRIVVMRGGKIVTETRASGMTASALADVMVERRAPRPPVLATAEARSEHETIDAGELSLNRSEILAIVGVAGNGQSQLGARLRAQLPAAGHIPEDRTRDGIVAEMSIAENLALRGVRNAGEIVTRYSIRAQNEKQRLGDLSGGNQQKVLLARELDRRPRLIVAAEPTRGLDIEATRFVHEQLRDAATKGAAVLLITSDLDEAFSLADAIQVIYRGNLSARMTRDEAAGRVANLMAGVA